MFLSLVSVIQSKLYEVRAVLSIILMNVIKLHNAESLSVRVVTIYHYINTYDYHTVYICLSTVLGENKRGRISPAPSNNFPLNCSLAPPTRTAETTSETDVVISIPRRNIN